MVMGTCLTCQSTIGPSAKFYLEGELRVGFARILEVRKVCGRAQHPRLSVRKSDASLCTAIVQLLVPRKQVARQPHTLELLESNRVRACPMAVPVVSLGRGVMLSVYDGPYSIDATLLGQCTKLVPCRMTLVVHSCTSLTLTRDLFEAAAMKVVKLDLLDMKVKELQDELAARGLPRSGSKHTLRHRLRAIIVVKRLRRATREEDGSSSED